MLFIFKLRQLDTPYFHNLKFHDFKIKTQNSPLVESTWAWWCSLGGELSMFGGPLSDQQVTESGRSASATSQSTPGDSRQWLEFKACLHCPVQSVVPHALEAPPVFKQTPLCCSHRRFCWNTGYHCYCHTSFTGECWCVAGWLTKWIVCTGRPVITWRLSVVHSCYSEKNQDMYLLVGVGRGGEGWTHLFLL